VTENCCIHFILDPKNQTVIVGRRANALEDTINLAKEKGYPVMHMRCNRKQLELYDIQMHTIIQSFETTNVLHDDGCNAAD